MAGPVLVLGFIDATVNGEALLLTPGEYLVLKALATKAGTLVTRAELSYACYAGKPAAPQSNSVDVLLSRVRKRLAEKGATDVIRSVRGQGYRYIGEVAQ